MAKKTIAGGALETTCADGLPPGHDIFCTPNNSSFYATKPYSELDSARQEIRLVKVHPDTGSGLIECTLLKETPLLEGKGHYMALSYCAGDPNKTDTILLNGTRFNVFANLRHALREVRRFWRKTYSDRECILWIDQISINQTDITERSHQVRFMREIYQYAEQVLVCLSTKNINPKGMDWLLRLAEDVPPRKNDLFLSEDPFAPQISSENNISGDDEEGIPTSRYHFHRLVKHIWASIMNEKFIKGWLAFYDLIEAPWWNRSWVFQEFIVASKVHFMYCGKYASWETLFPVWKAICSSHRHILMNRNHFLELNGAFRLDGPEDLNLCRVIERVKRGRSQAAVDTLEFIIDSKAGWSGKIALKDLLAHSRYCSTTDPRDKVFAYTGLADPAYGILPDYSHPIHRVLTDTTVKIIQVENSLDVLCHAAASRPQHNAMVPSWVVDWTCEELSNDIRNNHFGTEFWQKLTGLARNNADASFHTLEALGGCLLALQVRGAFIDELVIELRSDLDPAGQRALFRSFMSSRGFTIICSSFVQCHDELWVLDGCGVPLILRAQQNYGYSLISAASVIMKDDNKPRQENLTELVQLAKRQHGGWQVISLI